MSWQIAILPWLLHAAVGGSLFLIAGSVAVRLNSQPIRRVRLIEVALAGALAVPWVSQLPGLPHWSIGWLATPAPAQGGRRAEPAQPPASAKVSALPDKTDRLPTEAIPAKTVDGPAPAVPHVVIAQPRAAEERETPRLPVFIVSVYGLVALALLLRLFLGVRSLARLHRATSPVPPEIMDAFQRVAGPAGRGVSLRASDRIQVPLSFRCWRPIIVLPSALCEPGAQTALHYSLAHEWSHVEGGDVGRWYVANLVQSLYFFNPLCWWLRRQLRLCQDYLADARAARCASDPEDYAAYLVGLARRRLTTPAAALGIADRRSNLYRRVVMLLETRQPLERRCRGVWRLGTLLGGLVLLALCAFVRLDGGSPAAAAAEKSPPAKDIPKAEKAETLHYTGQVVDKDTRKPIAGATVTVRRSLLGDPEVKDYNLILQETKHKTDTDGKYRFIIPPEQTAKRYLYIELDVEHPDYAPRSHFGYALSMIRKNEKVGSRPFFEKVGMRAGKPITGTVQTPDGQPLAGMRVLAYSVTNNKQAQFEYGSFASGRTDAAGKFRLVVTTPGAAVFWLLPENHAPSTHRVKEDIRGDLGTFTVQPGIVLKGKVFDVRGKPMAGVLVNAEGRGRGEDLQGLMVAGQINRADITNDRGEFTMRPLPPGAYEVVPGDFCRDGSKDDRKRYQVPGVFLRQKVVLKEGPQTVEIRESPHVVVEAQYYDGKGKKSRTFPGTVFGKIDRSFWYGEGKIDADGKMTVLVPHGLEEASLQIITNEHGSLRFRKSKDEPFIFGRDLKLGTLNDDVRGIEVIHYKAPIIIVKVTARDGQKLSHVKLSGTYKQSKQPKLVPVNGPPTHISFEHQEDGRFRTSQLIPDEDVDVTAHAEGYKDRTIRMRLPEGIIREVAIVLDK